MCNEISKIDSEIICPVCKGRKVKLLGRLPDREWFAGKRLEFPLFGGNLYRCTNCSLKFRYPTQERDIYKDLYDNCSITTWTSEASRSDWKKIASYVQTTFPLGARVLDFGCYSGGLLGNLGIQYQKYGIEINQTAARIAMESNHLTVWQSMDDIPIGMKFDVIIASDVIEHVLNPKLLIDNLIKFVEEGGVLIITTGDADNYLWNFFGANWWYCFFSEHVSFISKQWLEHFYKEDQMISLHVETFYYVHLRIYNFIINWVLTLFYGISPDIHSRLGDYLKKNMRRNVDIAPKGVGLSPDHIFAILKKG